MTTIGSKTPSNLRTSGHAAERLLWLDIARVLSAFLILGIHWLRACYKLGMFGGGEPVNLVMDYQSHDEGVGMLRYVLIAGDAPRLSVWLTNLSGVLGGFGWEAVSALILISGFSLVIAERRGGQPGGRLQWYRRRVTRILLPFYVTALPLLALYAGAVTLLGRFHGHIAAALEAKLRSQFSTPLPGIISSHVVLLDPWAPQWIPNFFAPAWWFVPAILLAYLLYPLLRRASRSGGGLPLLCASACISAACYVAADLRIIINESWYYIVLQELFNFCLGIVLGAMWTDARRPALERTLRDPRAAGLALLVFAIANLANWSPHARPVASMLYGPSLALIVAFMGTRLERNRAGAAMASIDSYDLYLVHQPFAYPIALVVKGLLHSYAVFGGWFVFVTVAVAAAHGLARVLRGLETWGRRARSNGGIPVLLRQS